MTIETDEDLKHRFPDIMQMQEFIGIYEVVIKDVEVPLKIKIVRIGNDYIGVPNLTVREKGGKDYYRDMGRYPSKEAALQGTVNGFFQHLTPGASIREMKNWGI